VQHEKGQEADDQQQRDRPGDAFQEIHGIYDLRFTIYDWRE
jgi:hypothetical protein